MHFSRAHLHQLIPHLSPEVGSHISRALTLPRHLRMARLEARNYMEEYNQANSQIPSLLELAKLDFDMVQSLHQRELAEISRWLFPAHDDHSLPWTKKNLVQQAYSNHYFIFKIIFSNIDSQQTHHNFLDFFRWWKELELVGKLGFARDRPSECFLWTVGIFPEAHHSNCRIELTKTICILLVMDDIFDTYGSFDELILFNEAIKRYISRICWYRHLIIKINLTIIIKM